MEYFPAQDLFLKRKNWIQNLKKLIAVRVILNFNSDLNINEENISLNAW